MEQYPLEQMISIKKNRFDAAVKVLEEKKELLEKAYELLYDLTQDRDKYLEHKQDKVEQLKSLMDTGDIEKIKQAQAYLKLVEGRLLEKEKKVVEQQKAVDNAQKQVDIATDDLFQKKKDLEKLEIHKKEWEKEMKYTLLQKEGIEQDEQGSSAYIRRKREEERKKKNS